MINETVNAITKTLNTELGQELTENLLQLKLKENPNMTIEEWNETKQQFIVYLFNEAMKNDKNLMNQLATQVYNELKVV